MAHQASLNGGSRYQRPEGVLTTISELGNDIASLTELQAKLTAIDAKEVVGRATWPTALLVASAAIIVATVPVLLIGLAFVLAEAFGLNQGVALLVVGGVIAAIATVIAVVSLREFLRSFESFRRSREELVRNISWVRTVLTQSTRPTRRS